MSGRKHDFYLYAAAAAALISIVYWSLFAINAYNTFHEYHDVGDAAYSMYYHTNYPNQISGLQYLVFTNHIAPDQLLLLPIFYLFPEALTLLFVQAIVISLTGLLLFFVVKELSKSKAWGFIFCIVFLINPGVHGILIFDYHVEFLIIPLMLLVFYFYMKVNKPLFLISLLLMLGAVDTSPIVGVSLGLGLFLFDFVHTDNKKLKKQRMQLASVIIALSLIALLIYAVIDQSLLNSYATGYQNMPQIFQVIPFVPQQIAAIASQPISQLPISQWQISAYVYAALGLIAGVFFFGFLVLSDPLVSLLLAAPWLAKIFILGSFEYAALYLHYYVYVLGGTVIASILGLLLIYERKGLVARLIKKRGGHTVFSNYKTYLYHANILTRSTIMLITTILIFISPLFVLSKNVNYPQQDFLFQINASQREIISQLDFVMNQTPTNAPLMTASFVTPHVFTREYMEEPSASPQFVAQYVLVDYNLNVSQHAFDDYGAFVAYMSAHNYSLIVENGTAQLFKLTT